MLGITFLGILLFRIELFAYGYNVTFDPPEVKVFVDSESNFTVSVHGMELIADDIISLSAEPEFNLGVYFLGTSWQCELLVCNRSAEVKGRFLGFGKVHALLKNGNLSAGARIKLTPPLNVTIIRQDKLINKLFIIFVATVVTINYINFGCALEIDTVKQVLKKPIAPAIGFFCQFVIMPVVSYVVGYFIFTDPVLRLGLFTFGCSPGGGASNMWTVLLGGNLNLSITMTFISTIAAFGTIPLWLFILGRYIVSDTTIVVPYSNIMVSLVSLIIPISLGLLVQRFLPKIAARSKRLLAPICIVLIILIIILASVANTYIFFMLSWRMVIAASLSVWTGFAAGILVSMFFRFPYADVVAVSVETGIQNSGIAFVMLSYSLTQPVADMASVVPVAASIITPIPLFFVYCYIKVRNHCLRHYRMELETIRSKKNQYASTRTITEVLDKGNENSVLK